MMISVKRILFLTHFSPSYHLNPRASNTISLHNSQEDLKEQGHKHATKE